LMFQNSLLCTSRIKQIVFSSRSNAPKNRYVDVPCLDQSAVLLPQNGYIHANFVHSYSRKNAYILTQGPLDSTVADFWQMVWFSGASVVVIIDGVDGQCSPRQIDHFLFLGWPDYDVPSSAVGFLTFLDVINHDFIPPLIVHCSAGIGRTGASSLPLYQYIERVVDIRGIVSRMRCQRACTVQTSKQYAFIHQADAPHFGRKTDFSDFFYPVLLGMQK
uniref:Protein-tyrosine phosphatase n=1 Tax=Schistocephalus solidus TaxID=70667 RepID=A0A183SRM5_SCHSO